MKRRLWMVGAAVLTSDRNAHGEPRATLGPGSHFGEIAVLDPGPRAATITAETDVAAYMLEARDLRQLVREDSSSGKTPPLTDSLRSSAG